MTDSTVDEVLAELAELEDPRMREVNARHGDDHGVNLTKLRGVAKRLKSDQELALRLWATDDTAARLVAILISKPRAFTPAELDEMLREARAPKVHDWLVNYVVKKGPHAEELRKAWLADPDPIVASAGWALTSDAVTKRPEVLDLPALLDTIEAEMKDAPDRLQWEMNTCLATIGIRRPRTPGAGARHRRAPRGAEGLPHAAELHLALRADLDRRDGAPRAAGRLSAGRAIHPSAAPAA